MNGNGKCLSFHLFKRVEKKNLLTRLKEYCPSPLSSSIFSFSSSSSSSTAITPYDSLTSSNDTSSVSTLSSLTEDLFLNVPEKWTIQEFNDVSAFIHDYIDNTGTFDETSKTGLMLKHCNSVIIVEDSNYKYSKIQDEIESFTPERLVIAAIIISNENIVSSYKLNNTSLNDTFETPLKKILVDSMIFNESVKSSKRRILAMIIIHHIFQLCKVNEITSINASSNDETYQYFLDSGFSHQPIEITK